MAGLHSCGKLLWDIRWVTVYGQATEDNLHHECIKRTVIKGNDSAVVSAAQMLDMELCPAAGMVNHRSVGLTEGIPTHVLDQPVDEDAK